jgi:hypothetical protein
MNDRARVRETKSSRPISPIRPTPLSLSLSLSTNYMNINNYIYIRDPRFAGTGLGLMGLIPGLP